ncbi:tRNA (adenosine(37)-N6)-dimethylallyltransferase MiaA [Winogradskyella sp. PC-19]|uniref:tRNA (adenosine(37)-N6)-dimethylallyltransferase MiaA n=1 Tax=unclassified Winogradskyella TaxID=2615021 RepID=UPI000B3CECC3|nr:MULTISPECIES: tRNA (adenosine(37)-N6)-dimethylallyltransferase MiaA [unclassified Winogradskyella]ARV08144.1 tRNA (adenosine(37)-N6)-dimethylallyltransferase MiaA [Winogradskyella sp. PC-19]
MSKTLISIVGPTGIGKTALSIKLAQYFNTEIISSDSRQFFKEMTIGTAVPNKIELASAKHHFIQHISVEEPYNVGHYEKEAINKLKELFKTQDVIVMVGGSGLYSNAVINGLDIFPDIPKKIREELNLKLETEGIKILQLQLKELDQTSYNTIAINNPQRLIRALEICIGTGKPYSSFLSKNKTKRPFKTISIGIKAEREIIYDRINRRVDIMIENGLVDEARRLLPQKKLNALNTVGYKELFKHFEGEWTLDFAISEIKKNTRRFAKRQLTWYRKDETIKWFDYLEDVNLITSYIENKKPAK